MSFTETISWGVIDTQAGYNWKLELLSNKERSDEWEFTKTSELSYKKE